MEALEEDAGPRRRGAPADEEAALARAAAEVNSCLAAGAFSRALRQLSPQVGLATPEAAQRAVADLFPQAACPAPGAYRPPTAGDEAEFDRQLATRLSRYPRRSAPGPGATRFEHLAGLAEVPGGAAAVAELLRRWARPDLPEPLRELLVATRLVPLAKNGNAQECRPLALGHVWRRLYATVTAHVLRDRFHAVVKEHQFALGAASGAEAVHKLVSVALHERAQEARHLTLDAASAFQMLDRAAVLHAVDRHLPGAAVWVATFLVTPGSAHGRLADGSAVAATQRRGLSQGCPLAPLLYCLGTHALLGEIARRSRQRDPRAIVVAYADDINVVANPAGLIAGWEAACGGAAAAGLTFNAHKSRLAALHGTPAPIPQLPVPAVDRPEVLRQGPWEPVPAAEACQDPAGVAEYTGLVQTRRDKLRRLGQLRQAGVSLQGCWHLAHYFLNGDFLWKARTLGLPADVAADLDDVASAFLIELFELDGTSPHVARVHHAVRDGGLGILPARVVAGPARLASWAAVLPVLMERMGAADMRVLAARVPELAGVADALATQLARQLRVDTPVDPLLAGPAALQQRHLVRESLDNQVAQWRAGPALQAGDRAWQLSCGGQGAGLWLTPHAHVEAYMCDSTFRLAVQLRLRQDVLGQVHQCPFARPGGGACGAPLDAAGDHVLQCPVAGGLVRRHHVLRDTWAALVARHADTQTYVEQLVPGGVMEVASEVPVRGVSLWDTTVCHPCTVAAGRSGAASRPGVAALLGEQQKRRKYAQLGGRFSALAFEAGGRPGGTAAEAVRGLAGGCSQVAARVWCLLGAAVQRMNAARLLAAQTAGAAG